MTRLTARPTGTVTFLFTDIEGSTRLWDEKPEAMAKALVRHDEILGSVVESHAGVIFKHTGDGICAAFQDPADALDAALAGQTIFRAEVFDSIGRIAVRMAIHTGHAADRSGDYRGPALNRVARLLDVAVGGEILLTDTAENKVRATLPDSVGLADRGLRRLRDISEPGHIYHVEAPGDDGGLRAGVGVPGRAAGIVTVLVAAAIAVFAVANPPGTNTPETTAATESATTSPPGPTTSLPGGNAAPRWVARPGGSTVAIAAHDGVVYAGSRQTGLHAYRASDANTIWPDPGLVVDADLPLREPAGAPISGAPVVGPGVVVYSTYLGTLHAVEAESGELLWWHRFERCPGSACSPIVPSQPVILDDAVFVVAGPELYRFDAMSGDHLRRETGLGSPTAGPVASGDSIYVAEGAAFVEFRSNDLELVNALNIGAGTRPGRRAEAVSIVLATAPRRAPAGFEHGVFITDAGGVLTRRSEETGSLHPAWVTIEGDPVEIEVATVPVVAAPVGRSPDPILWAVDPAGSLMRINAESGGRVAVHAVGATTHAVTVGADGVVYVATDAPELVAYDPIQGSEKFRIALEVAPAAVPVELSGTVFIAGVDGAVRAYGEVGRVVLADEESEQTPTEGSISDVSWSSDGALAFVRDEDIWIVPAGQDEAVNVTASGGGGSAPAWSPDGTVLAYVSGATGSGDVVLIRPDGTDRRNLTATGSEDERDPDWSPDGSRIIFSSRTCAGQGGLQPERVCSPLSELGVVDPITGRTSAVIGTAAVFSAVRDPSWSPTGDLIAFAGDRSGGAEPGTSRWHLWTMTPAGGDLTSLPDPDRVGGRVPAFSPDGSKLAYRAGSEPVEEAALYVLDLLTGFTTRISNLPMGTGDPAWSPDGLRLAFAADMWTPGRIYTVSVDP